MGDDIELLDAYSLAVIRTLEQTRAGVLSLRLQGKRGRGAKTKPRVTD